jgi:CheY-like chemotaxis protein
MKLLLYVDDDPDDLLLFEAACRIGKVSFDLRAVSGSAEGLAYLAGEGAYADRLRYPMPDAILCDIKMRGADGFEVLARIRAETRTRAIPFVLFTASVLPSDAKRGLECGATACISKPVALARTVVLAQAIDACIAAGSGWEERLGRFTAG